MVHVKGPTPTSCSKVLTELFMHGDQSVDELQRRTGLDRKTVYKVLKPVLRNECVKRIPTGVGNQVKYHLPEMNYGIAMACHGWAKTRWKKRSIKKSEDDHKRLGQADAEVSALLDKLRPVLSSEGKDIFPFLIQLNINDRLMLARRIADGLICLDCLNNRRGLHSTQFDNGQEVYVCEKCGMEQKQPVPFDGKEKHRQRRGVSSSPHEASEDLLLMEEKFRRFVEVENEKKTTPYLHRKTSQKKRKPSGYSRRH
mgnify:CR=1 FL=1